MRMHHFSASGRSSGMQAVSPYMPLLPQTAHPLHTCDISLSKRQPMGHNGVLDRPNLESDVLDGLWPPGKNSNPNLKSKADGNEISPGTLISIWVADNAAFIRGIDPNHMARSPSRQTRLRAAHSCPDPPNSDPAALSCLPWVRCTGAAVLSWLATSRLRTQSPLRL